MRSPAALIERKLEAATDVDPAAAEYVAEELTEVLIEENAPFKVAADCIRNLVKTHPSCASVPLLALNDWVIQSLEEPEQIYRRNAVSLALDL